MKILLVEDDPNKAKAISEFLPKALLRSDITQAKSYKSARNALNGGTFDLVLMDMSLPTFDVTAIDQGGSFLPFAGRELMRQMRRSGNDTPVIVVTQFDRFGEGPEAIELSELSRVLGEQFPRSFRGAIFYSAQSGTWRAKLGEMLNAERK